MKNIALMSAILALLASTAPASAQTIVNALDQSHCAKFAAEFTGKVRSIEFRVLPIHSMSTAKGTFSIMLADDTGLPVIGPKGGYWAYTPPYVLEESGVRIYNTNAPYGAWLVVKWPENTQLTETSTLDADIFIHVPSTSAKSSGPSCYRFGEMKIPALHLPPMDPSIM
jgi:hypothetical protein